MTRPIKVESKKPYMTLTELKDQEWNNLRVLLSEHTFGHKDDWMIGIGDGYAYYFGFDVEKDHNSWMKTDLYIDSTNPADHD